MISRAHDGVPVIHCLPVPVSPFMKPVNAYLVEGDTLALVDTGPKGARSLAALRGGIAQLGHSLADIRQIVITHPHVDHFGLARQIIAESGARVFVHPRGWRRLTEWEAEQRRGAELSSAFLRRAGANDEMWALYRFRAAWLQETAESVPADSPAGFLEDGQSIILAGLPWRALYTPGHCDAHVCLYEPASGTLLSGDFLLPDFSFIPVNGPPPEEGSDQCHATADFLASLERTRRLEVRALLPGHGLPGRSSHALIDRERGMCEAECQVILRALADGPRTAYQIWSGDPRAGRRKSLDSLTGIELIGSHLDTLQTQGRVSSFAEGGLVFYREPEHSRADCATTTIH